MVPVETLSSAEEAYALTSERPFLLRQKGTDEGGTLDPTTLLRRHPGGVEVVPIVHPQRKRPEFDVLKAWRHFRIVLEDKEQTDQIVAVADALP